MSSYWVRLQLVIAAVLAALVLAAWAFAPTERPPPPPAPPPTQFFPSTR